MSLSRSIRRKAEQRQAKVEEGLRREAALVRAAEREAEARRRAENPPTPEQRRAVLRMGRIGIAAALAAAAF